LEEVSSLSSALRSFATLLGRPVPARNAEKLEMRQVE
jgi:hypothetical protein